MKRYLLLILAIIACIAMTSCIKKPIFDPQKPGNEQGGNGNEEEDNDDPEIVELAITRFVIPKEFNIQLKEDLVFEIYDSNIIFAYLKNSVDITGLTAQYEVEGTGNVSVKIKNVPQKNGMTTNDFSEDVIINIQDSKKSKAYTVRLIPYTGLPVAIIRTTNGKMPTSKDVWVGATLKIDGMDKFAHTVQQNIEIKRRGNSTFGYAKRSFNIRLKEQQPVLGMKKHKRWSLLANYRDKTLLRNDVTFHIGQNFTDLGWTPHNQFAEMIFNGEYVGNYEITEQIRVDNDRINIQEMLPSDISGEALTGGYLLELDRNNKDTDPNKFKTSILELPMLISEPDEDILNPAQFNYIQQYCNEIDVLINEGNFQKVYDQYIDITSFADYWLVQEITGNTEYRKSLSIFLHKDRGGKLKAGPLWDFDYSTYIYSKYIPDKEKTWFKALSDDPTFRAKLKERYNANLAFLNTVPQYIETRREELRLSAEQNWVIWPELTVKTNGDEDLPSDEAIDKMIRIYNDRVTSIGNLVNGF